MQLADAAERHPVGHHLQCADHRGAHPARAAGVQYRPIGAAAVLVRNLLIYGLGGIIVPFVGIKLIDMLITAIGLA